MFPMIIKFRRKLVFLFVSKDKIFKSDVFSIFHINADVRKIGLPVNRSKVNLRSSFEQAL